MRWPVTVACFALAGALLTACQNAEPPPPPSTATPDAPAPGGAAAPGGGAKKDTAPKAADPQLAEREKQRLQKREEVRRKEEEELRHTLFITENPVHDVNVGRYDPFVEVNPNSDLSPIIGMRINPFDYRVSGFAKQGERRFAVLELGRRRTKVLEEGDAFYNEYEVKGDALFWRSKPVRDGEILPNGEIVDEVKVFENMIVVADVNIDQDTVTLRTVARDKTPSQQATLELGARPRSNPADVEEGANLDVNLDDLTSDDYIRYLYQKVTTEGDKGPQDYNTYLKQIKKHQQQGQPQGAAP